MHCFYGTTLLSFYYMYIINVQSLYLNSSSIVGDWMGGGHKLFVRYTNTKGCMVMLWCFSNKKGGLLGLIPNHISESL